MAVIGGASSSRVGDESIIGIPYHANCDRLKPVS